jgi:ABC-type phosphate transport system auxiliary subunit
MGKHKIRDVKKKLTEAERLRHAKIRRQIESEKEELIAYGRRSMARHAKLRNAVDILKSTRETLGLTLADIKARTGIEKGNLSRLENAVHPNPTIDTLTRYADAVGKELVIELIDKTSP